MRFINETTAFKILVERNGIMLSITTKNRAFYFFVSDRYIGGRVAPTTDPFPGIVEICGYDINRILDSWNRLSRSKIMKKGKRQDFSAYS